MNKQTLKELPTEQKEKILELAKKIVKEEVKGNQTLLVKEIIRLGILGEHYIYQHYNLESIKNDNIKEWFLVSRYMFERLIEIKSLTLIENEYGYWWGVQNFKNMSYLQLEEDILEIAYRIIYDSFEI